MLRKASQLKGPSMRIAHIPDDAVDTAETFRRRGNTDGLLRDGQGAKLDRIRVLGSRELATVVADRNTLAGVRARRGLHVRVGLRARADPGVGTSWRRGIYEIETKTKRQSAYQCQSKGCR